MSEFTIRPASDSDLPAVAETYNHAVLNTTATFDLVPRDETYFQNWLEAHSDPIFRAFVEEDREGRFTGYGSLSTLTPRAGYRVSAEISVYVHPDVQGRGVGGRMTEFLIGHARKSGLYSLLGILTSTNIESARMIVNRGFVKTGEMNAVAAKFGQVLNLHVHQLHFPENWPQGVEVTF